MFFIVHACVSLHESLVAVRRGPNLTWLAPSRANTGLLGAWLAGKTTATHSTRHARMTATAMRARDGAELLVGLVVDLYCA